MVKMYNFLTVMFQRFLKDKREVEVARMSMKNLKGEAIKARAALQDALRRADEAEMTKGIAERDAHDRQER